MKIEGAWVNEYGSVMTLQQVGKKDGILQLEGSYSSDTGATGRYYVSGIADTKPNPDADCQLISLNIFWESLDALSGKTPCVEVGAIDPLTQHRLLSSYTGQLQLIDGREVLTFTHTLVKDTGPQDSWASTLTATLTFRRPAELVSAIYSYSKEKNRHITLPLEMGQQTDNGATPWFATLLVGTGKEERGGQRLKFMVDTGTTHTWITAKECTTTACSVHRSFNSKHSSTFRRVGEGSQVINFGPWGEMEAHLGEDVFAPLRGHDDHKRFSEQLRFYLATHYEGQQFQQLACDGGIAIPAVLPQGVDSSEILPQLRNEQVIDQPIVSFCFDPGMNEGEVCFGAVDTGRFEAESLNIVPLLVDFIDPDFYYLWMVQLSRFSLKSPSETHCLFQDLAFCLDTGSSFFKSNAAIHKAIVDRITAANPKTVYDHETPRYEDYPDVELTINGQVYTLTPRHYFVQAGPQRWQLGFQEMDGLPDGFLLAGSVFLNTLYTVFYYQTNNSSRKAIGLGRRG